jgi:hypothetical protein
MWVKERQGKGGRRKLHIEICDFFVVIHYWGNQAKEEELGGIWFMLGAKRNAYRFSA